MKEVFKLPEYWCIEVTEQNSDIVGEYFGNISDVYKSWSKRMIKGKYLRSHNDENQIAKKGSNASFSNHEPVGLELTTEQFVKYVVEGFIEYEYDPTLEDIYKKLLE